MYGLSGLVLFLLLNIEIADYFSIGPTLTFSFAGNFARDMTYTISWSLFAFGMLLIGMIKQIRPLRFGARPRRLRRSRHREEGPLAGDPFERVDTARQKLDPGPRDQVLHRPRDQDFPRPGE